MRMNRMSCLSPFLLLLCVFFHTPTFAQKISPTGNWKGSSLCQVKNSPCHDETVVYHITAVPQTDSVRIVMNKIVNGAEEEMGTLTCLYDALHQTLTGSLRKTDVWLFQLTGTSMHGTLVVNGVLYRLIDVKKSG
jgi:hypothetical protein